MDIPKLRSESPEGFHSLTLSLLLQIRVLSYTIDVGSSYRAIANPEILPNNGAPKINNYASPKIALQLNCSVMSAEGYLVVRFLLTRLLSKIYQEDVSGGALHVFVFRISFEKTWRVEPAWIFG